ncbi:MAG TPA: glycosyl transferase, partial [Blastocatellia bacterium]|nr:glycosyl transferase [Blastocatellia bacterium]
MQIVLASLTTFLLAIILTLIARAAAHRIGIVAAPRQDRWHSKPTAMLGGVAIYGAFATGYLLFAPRLATAYPVLIAATLLLVTGLVDDILRIKPYAKLVVQLSAAAAMVYFGLRLPWVDYQWINDILTIFWLVGITNAINLLD